VAAEIRRVLKPNGLLFLQLYPFYHSPWGSHLEEWFPEPFVQHRMEPDHIRAVVRETPLEGKPAWGDYMLEAYNTLNRISLDDLQAALRSEGFVISKAELYTSAVHIPVGSQDYPLSSLMISGVKLIAQPDAAWIPSTAD
jgi:hypothetical protein